MRAVLHLLLRDDLVRHCLVRLASGGRDSRVRGARLRKGLVHLTCLDLLEVIFDGNVGRLTHFLLVRIRCGVLLGHCRLT